MKGIIGWLLNDRRYVKLALSGAFFVCCYLFFSQQNIAVDINNADKWAHIIVFFGLSFLLFFSTKLARYWQVLILLAYGAGVEVVQHFISYRSGGFDDVLADATGIFLFYGLSLAPLLFNRRRSSDK
ncbi:MAG: VanZ family protein [Psychrobium sp.]|nr:VanZ family protein [Psychrobium sp.]